MKQKELIKEYKRDSLTVVWQPSKCIHSKACFHGLPNVFNPENRPWIQLDAADIADIESQVKACPSGALSLLGAESKSTENTAITVTKGGPLLIEGNLMITTVDGETTEKKGTTALCRCGASKNKPYCDGSHQNIAFDS